MKKIRLLYIVTALSYNVVWMRELLDAAAFLQPTSHPTLSNSFAA